MNAAAPATPLVWFEHVTRWYGQVVALRDVSIPIGNGVLGLLGPNGAGKTTFIRVLTGCMPPSQGRALLFGLPAFGTPDLYRRIGYCPDHDNFFEFMTGREFVETLLGVHGFGASDRKARAARALDRVKANEFADRTPRGCASASRSRRRSATTRNS
ncbi:MAG: ABC transporter-like [Planctomycetota bacterium]|nr:MAG: ABC transporter-like [Planctomycetota bacterium]